MRLLLYSPDSYGLGHVRRSLKIASHLLETNPEAQARVVTGSPRAHYFGYPQRCDYIRLPRITKDASGQYVPADRERSLEDVLSQRTRFISFAADAFDPDVMLVDHSPRGLCGEVLPALRRLARRRPNTVRVLGLRDIIDESEVVQKVWKNEQVLDVLRNDYDRILVYGRQKLFDPIRSYGIPSDIAGKMSFVGYIPSAAPTRSADEIRRRFAPRTGKLVLVTLGGGGDGNLVLRSFLDGYRAMGADAPFEVVALTGPLMSRRKRDRFRAQADDLPGVTLMEYASDMPSFIHAANFVVSMGGYNTVCEAACAGARSLIVPRNFPRKEQLLRANMLSDAGVARCLPPEDASPRELMRQVLEGLCDPAPAVGWNLGMDGLTNTTDELVELVARRRVASSPVLPVLPVLPAASATPVAAVAAAR